jgi:hypothetical protein
MGAFAALCFGCGYLTAFIVTRNHWRDEMIERGMARYDGMTGKWDWRGPATNDSPAAISESLGRILRGRVTMAENISSHGKCPEVFDPFGLLCKGSF